MFNKNFYPTNRATGLRMISGLTLSEKQVFEPQAGKGDLVDLLNEFGAHVTICELNEDLAKISSSKAERFLKPDFLEVTKEEVSHFDFIIMNPPFSADEIHILHAWEICPNGCQIVSLCNSETINNTWNRNRKSLSNIIVKNGSSESIGNVFSGSERTTDVGVSIVKLYKPKSESEDEFNGYFDLSEDYTKSDQEGIVKHNEITEIVNRYVGAVRQFNSVLEKNEEINKLIEPIKGNRIRFGAFEGQNAVSREVFKKELQKSAWKTVFNKFNMQKYMTNSVMEDLNKFVEKQSHVPFTINNIYKMVEMIVGTQGQRMKRVIVEAFDTLTKHHHDNRFQVEGWKTNSEYRVNKKFILSWAISNEYGEMHARYSSNGYVMDELTKALCFVTGNPYDNNLDWWAFIHNHKGGSKYDYREFGKWYDYGFFEIKGFKKGTLHVKFKSDDVWEKFNKIACEEKGFMLASKFTSDFRQKKTDIAV